MNFHGGNVHQYKQRLIDFSSNINPLGVPESFKFKLICSLEEFTKYPDIRYIALRQAIGEYLGVPNIEYIVPGNGAIELLYGAVRHSGKKRIISLKPTFSEYAKAASQYEMKYLSVNALDEEYNNIDIELILKEVDKDSAVIICNPNNPTGSLISKRLMLQLAEALQSKHASLIIDEAFMEFTSDYPLSSMIDQLENFNNLIVVKAATKFFGMPGIRLGYAVSANETLLHDLREGMEPWNVNSAAVLAGCSVLQDIDYISRSRVWIHSERSFMYNELKEVKGLKVYSSTANFHLVKLLRENFDAWQLKRKLLEKDILIRTPEGFEDLDGQFVRLAVKKREDNIILLQAIKEIMEKI